VAHILEEGLFAEDLVFFELAEAAGFFYLEKLDFFLEFLLPNGLLDLLPLSLLHHNL